MADNVEANEEHLIVVREPEVVTAIQDDHSNVKSIPTLASTQTSAEADQIRAEEDRILLDEGKIL